MVVTEHKADLVTMALSNNCTPQAGGGFMTVY